jgi:ATP phosphoribosyltransferase
MLKIAVPNKGSLAEPATEMLRASGYATRQDTRTLVLRDPEHDVALFFLRPRDIAVYVGAGRLDVGITGRDLLLDSSVQATEVMSLGFATSTFRFASRPGEVEGVEKLAGRRIATSYPGLVRRYLAERGMEADVVRLDGAVETAVELGVADVIAYVVETGSTLRAAGLEVFGEPILRSEAVIVRRGGRADAEPEGLDVLSRRLQGVLVARRYVMMDYDIRVEMVDEACNITPGLESPTVSPLHDRGWVAVRSMVPRAKVNKVMDQLYDIGARAILVTTIHACRI